MLREAGYAQRNDPKELVLLDEAFSKMDEGRIQATLKFARGLGLTGTVAATAPPPGASVPVLVWMSMIPGRTFALM